MRTILNYVGEASNSEAVGGWNQTAGLSDTGRKWWENTED